MATRTIKLPMLYRLATIERADGPLSQGDDRKVNLTFSSEQPYTRWYGDEILGHKDGEVRMDRINSSAPFLEDHDHTKQIGVIESARIHDGQGHATARLSKNPHPQEVLNDIQDGIKRNISVGYIIHELQDVTPPPDSDDNEGASGPIPVKNEDLGWTDPNDDNDSPNRCYRATDWEPHEISLVSMPADTSVGIGKSFRSFRDLMADPEVPKYPCRIVDNRKSNNMPTTPAPQITVEETRKKAQADERTRVSEILKLGRETPTIGKLTRDKITAEAERCINEDGTPEQFKDWIIRELSASAVASVHAGSATGEYSITPKEASQYSIRKAILQSWEQRRGSGRLDGFELEMSQEVGVKTNRKPNGFFVPDFALCPPLSRNPEFYGFSKRDLSTLTQAGGAFAVESTVLGTELVELYRKRMYVMKAGARYLGGLQGNMLIPRQTGPATVYWLAENATVTESDQTFGQFSLNPHTAIAQTAYSKQFVAQSSIDVEGFVRNDLNKIIAIAQDAAALTGTGNAGQPLGVGNYPTTAWTRTVSYSAGGTTTSSITFGAGYATFAKVVDMETAIASQDADVDSMAYITSPIVRGDWKTIGKTMPVGTSASGYAAPFPIFLWDGLNGTDQGTVNGYRAFATNQLGTASPGVVNQVIFGNWADLIIANWAGIDVVTDPYTQAKTGEIVVTIHLMCDVGLRHPTSFCISTDSGAQGTL